MFVDDVEIDAKDGTAPGESSIAVFVADSAEVVFERVMVIGGKGVNGETKQKKLPVANAGKGSGASNPVGGDGAKNVCPDGDSSGGKGGTIGQNNALAGEPQALGGGVAGQVATSCVAGGSGGTGGLGAVGTKGGAIAVRGTLTAAGWKATPGNSGSPGTKAQGGGGGGARAGAGGGGGAGGCGGEGGGGGASLAIVVFSSKLTLTACRVNSTAPGNGGDGAGGQPGQPHGGGGAAAPARLMMVVLVAREVKAATAALVAAEPAASPRPSSTRARSRR